MLCFVLRHVRRNSFTFGVKGLEVVGVLQRFEFLLGLFFGVVAVDVVFGYFDVGLTFKFVVLLLEGIKLGHYICNVLGILAFGSEFGLSCGFFLCCFLCYSFGGFLFFFAFLTFGFSLRLAALNVMAAGGEHAAKDCTAEEVVPVFLTSRWVSQ